jgi:hypothetical protein
MLLIPLVAVFKSSVHTENLLPACKRMLLVSGNHPDHPGRIHGIHVIKLAEVTMIFVRQLDSEEIRELKRITRQEIGRIAKRAQIVLTSAKNVSVPIIAALFEVSPANVRFWIRKFESEGPKGLLGSKSKLPAWKSMIQRNDTKDF